MPSSTSSGASSMRGRPGDERQRDAGNDQQDRRSDVEPPRHDGDDDEDGEQQQDGLDDRGHAASSMPQCLDRIEQGRAQAPDTSRRTGRPGPEKATASTIDCGSISSGHLAACAIA